MKMMTLSFAVLAAAVMAPPADAQMPPMNNTVHVLRFVKFTRVNIHNEDIGHEFHLIEGVSQTNGTLADAEVAWDLEMLTLLGQENADPNMIWVLRDKPYYYPGVGPTMTPGLFYYPSGSGWNTKPESRISWHEFE